ncbi:MAG: transporter [Prosthecobacter sp.]|nr:transporter [Prosthecobacter sp.]
MALFAALAGSAAAQDKSAPAPIQDKTQYHLFNPTPVALMREMSTDRPDTTESPYTVDAGHFQVEMSFFDYERSFDSGMRTEAWSFGQMNLKAGLFDNTDLQLIFDAYDTVRTTGQGITTSLSGFTDITVRLKTNLWGNESGTTALALMPYVGIPTRANLGSDRWAGGLIVPLGVKLTDRLSLGLMIEADLVPDANTSGYDLAWVHTATLGVELTKQLGAYVELVGIADAGGGPYQALFDAGLTFGITDNLVFDAGIRVGLNNDTPEFGTFTGMSFRF